MFEAEEKGAGIFEILIIIVSSPCIGNDALYFGGLGLRRRSSCAHSSSVEGVDLHQVIRSCVLVGKALGQDLQPLHPVD